MEGYGSTHLVRKVVHTIYPDPPVLAALYILPEEKRALRKSYAHDIIDGGDPAIWRHATM